MVTNIKNGERIQPDITKYLIPGCGFGGSCFPKDLKALKHLSNSLELDPLILNAVLKVNERQPMQIINLLRSGLKNFNQKIF